MQWVYPGLQITDEAAERICARCEVIAKTLGGLIDRTAQCPDPTVQKLAGRLKRMRELAEEWLERFQKSWQTNSRELSFDGLNILTGRAARDMRSARAVVDALRRGLPPPKKKTKPTSVGEVVEVMLQLGREPDHAMLAEIRERTGRDIALETAQKYLQRHRQRVALAQ